MTAPWYKGYTILFCSSIPLIPWCAFLDLPAFGTLHAWPAHLGYYISPTRFPEVVKGYPGAHRCLAVCILVGSMVLISATKYTLHVIHKGLTRKNKGYFVILWTGFSKNACSGKLLQSGKALRSCRHRKISTYAERGNLALSALTLK